MSDPTLLLEKLEQIDTETNGTLLKEYPSINWKGVKGIRDVLSHNYFNIDAEEIFFYVRITSNSYIKR